MKKRRSMPKLNQKGLPKTEMTAENSPKLQVYMNDLDIENEMKRLLPDSLVDTSKLDKWAEEAKKLKREELRKMEIEKINEGGDIE